MKSYNLRKIIALTFLQLPALLWVAFSFKMHKNAFSGTSGVGKVLYKGNRFIEHSGSNILTAEEYAHWEN